MLAVKLPLLALSTNRAVALPSAVPVLLEAGLIPPEDVIAPEKLPVLADNTNLPVEFPNSIVLDVGTSAVVFAVNPLVVKLAALTAPVWNAPVVLAMNDVPTVNRAELTDVDILANPVPIIAVLLAMKLVPTVSSAELTLVDIFATVPVTVPVKSPVLADTTQRCVEFPNKTVFDDGVKLVPEITKLPDSVLESVF